MRAIRFAQLGTLALLILCLATQIAHAQPVSASKYNHPGGIVELYIPKMSARLPQVRFGIREPVLIEQKDHWRILIGISLATVPGEYVAYVKQIDEPAFNLSFVVEPKTFAVRKNPLNAQDSHYATTHTVFSELNFSNTVQPLLPLQQPITGKWPDLFGQIIVHETSELRAQNYVSLTTTELSNITAPQNAIVSRIVFDKSATELATIFLDHGRGLYSIISGVSDVTVETGNGVVAGAVLGKMPTKPISSPATVTWQCVINGVYINPLILTKI